LDAPQPGDSSAAPHAAEVAAMPEPEPEGESADGPQPASYASESGRGPAGPGGFELGPDGQPREGHRRKRRRGRRGGRNRHRHGEGGGFAPREARPVADRQPAPPLPRSSQEGEPRAFRVTTPAEAGIAFLDGPRIGGYGPEPEESEPPAPARAESAPSPRVAPAGEPPRVTPSGVPSHDEPPAPSRAAPAVAEAPAAVESPEERERRLRASKTEIVDVSKVEGAPAKRGWWRRG
jgi:ribonuclease E